MFGQLGGGKRIPMEYEIEVHGGKQGLYFEVRGNSAGFVQHNEPRLQDTIIRRSSRFGGPRIVTYQGSRYYVRGGIRTLLFITLGLEIKGK